MQKKWFMTSGYFGRYLINIYAQIGNLKCIIHNKCKMHKSYYKNRNKCKRVNKGLLHNFCIKSKHKTQLSRLLSINK